MHYDIDSFKDLKTYFPSDFMQALLFDLEREGLVYEDVSNDPGGPTACGITYIDGNHWRTRQGLAPLTIEQARKTKLSYLTPKVIVSIYYTEYWVPMLGTELPSPLDAVLFDSAVNTGVAQTVKFVQRILGIKDDGVLGPNTKAAINNFITAHGQEMLINGLNARRVEFYNRLAAKRPSYTKFLCGWINRINLLSEYAKSVLAKNK